MCINLRNISILVQKAIKSVNKLERLIKDLLDVQKINHGKLDMDITTFDFNEMLDEAIEEVQISCLIMHYKRRYDTFAI